MRLLLAILFTVPLWSQGWADLPNTHLQTACPANNGAANDTNYANYAYNNHCAGVINEWSGAAVDTLRQRLVLVGGGHSGYYGNEIYTLDLVTASSTSGCTGTCQSTTGVPAIRRMNDLSPYDFTTGGTCPSSGAAGTYCEANADGTPVAGHTYGSNVYLPVQDAIFDLRTFLSPNARGVNNTWWFNLASNTWTAKDPTVTTGGGVDIRTLGFSGSTGAKCAYDTNTQSVFCAMINPYLLLQYFPAINKWLQLNSSFRISGDNGPGTGTYTVIDPVRKWMFFIGNDHDDGSGVARFRYVDISGNDATYALVDIVSSVTGCSAANTKYPGLSYDPARGTITIYPLQGTSVLLFNPTTGVCSTHTFSGSIPTGTTTGVFGRFAYVPVMGAYYLVNLAANDAYKLTLDATPTFGLGSSTYACLDRDGDGYGVGPNAAGPCTDLAVDSSNNKLVSSSCHAFTVDDMSRVIDISGGTGFTAGSYRINGVTAGVATLLSSPAATSSTGGSFTMAGCLGSDADDLDAGVHTAAQGISKYGSEAAFLAHLGRSPERIFYLDTVNGVNATGAANDITKPFLTYAGILSSGGYTIAGGDTVFIRAPGYSGTLITPPSGTYGHPVTIAGYPGEYVKVTGTSSPFANNNLSYLWFDNLRFCGDGGANNGPCLSGGESSEALGASALVNNLFTSLEGHLCKWGLSQFNGVTNTVVEGNNLWGNWRGVGDNEHGIYMGARGKPGLNVSIRRNILNRNERTGVQWNGRGKNIVVEQNLAINNVLSAYSFESGMSHSFVRSNVGISNGATGISTFHNYHDASCGFFGQATPASLSACTWSSGTATCAVSNPGSPPNLRVGEYAEITTVSPSGYNVNATISGQTSTSVSYPVASNPGSYVSGGAIAVGFTGCPFDQTYNLIENNSSYNTGTDSEGTTSGVTGQPVIKVDNTSVGKVGDMGHNTFRNNVGVMFGSQGQYAPIVFPDNDQTYLSTSTFDTNTMYLDNPDKTGSPMFGYAYGTVFTCSGAAGLTTLVGTCSYADPKFAAAAITNWGTPSAFNLKLLASSPALGTGAANTTVYDVTGAAMSLTAPNLGAYAGSVGSAPAGGSVIGGKVSLSGKVSHE